MYVINDAIGNNIDQSILWSLAEKAACFLNEKAWDHPSAAPWPTLATNAAADEFKLAVLMYRCLHSTVLPYLADELYRVVDIDLRRCLRLASTLTLVVPPMLHSTIGDCIFSVVASRIWNSLPSSVTSSTSLSAFRRHLKTELLCGVSTWIVPDDSALLCSYHVWLQLCLFFIVKCSCSPRILWHFNCIHS